jgi:hypothetical protein
MSIRKGLVMIAITAAEETIDSHRNRLRILDPRTRACRINIFGSSTSNSMFQELKHAVFNKRSASILHFLLADFSAIEIAFE